ncbi:hypothetical protein D9V84_09450 [Bacteroidetes/Chlorobi group bacterium Naka2016]|jgi:hypothetical protein|nr:MAG: hypothetical protein D9V84_09450 [Bacteroidetes/Chlorobi group bacterium Naka2016]
MMKKFYYFFLISAFVALLNSCGSFHTRTESELYTIVVRDTLNQIEVKNAPGRRDNGIVYPSSKVLQSTREITTRDSLVERYYPNFIRLGVFESVGLIGTATTDQLGAGPFGIFPEVEKVPEGKNGYEGKLFSGAYYRFGIGEWRLRWFRDSKNWSIGTSLFEIIAKDNYRNHTLSSTFPIYIKKRFFISEKIPYISISPSFGFGLYPSQYINPNVAFEVGSLGGLNLRLYAGYAIGQNPTFSPFNNDPGSETQIVTTPYLGLGVSFLDFVNIVPELYTEWKDHPHSSWNIGMMQFALLYTNSDTSLGKNTKSLVKGVHLRIFPASISIPILDNGFYLGTSLFNGFIFGLKDIGLSILPIRLGYWRVILPDELSIEPFVEYNYFPSTFIHIGNRFNLKISESFNFSIVMGYVDGNNKRFVNAAKSYVNDAFDFTPYENFSRYYLGVSIGIIDRIFQSEELRYNKEGWKK